MLLKSIVIKITRKSWKLKWSNSQILFYKKIPTIGLFLRTLAEVMHKESWMNWIWCNFVQIARSYIHNRVKSFLKGNLFFEPLLCHKIFMKHLYIIKGQLISEWNFGVFNSPKMPTKFLTYFCPSFILARNLSKLWLFGRFEDTKFHSEINWPLWWKLEK